MIKNKPNSIKIKNIAVFVFSRAVVYYLALFFLSIPLINYPQIKLQSQLRDLNTILPKSFGYLIKLSQMEETPRENPLMEYFFFYGRTAFYFPKEADALGMTGFCLYYLGDWKGAEENYKKAMQYEPGFFWYPYDLAVLYFKNNQFDQAAAYFEKAASVPIEKTINFIKASPAIYRMIIQEDPEFANKSSSRIKQAASQAYQYMVLSYFYRKDYEKMFQKALWASQNNSVNYDIFNFYAGVALYQMKRYKEAQNYFEKAATASPQFKDAVVFGQISQKMVSGDVSGPSLNSLFLAEPSYYQNKIFPQIF